jgi:uncharacterized protein (DUF885 family)
MERKRAQDKMGKQFDIKNSTKKVLESGVMPLALLESKLMHGLQRKK